MVYALQLSLYQYILERVYGLLVREEDKALIVVGKVLESVPEAQQAAVAERLVRRQPVRLQEIRRLNGGALKKRERVISRDSSSRCCCTTRCRRRSLSTRPAK